MKLSEISGVRMDVLRDGEFNSIGTPSEQKKRSLVAVADASSLQSSESNRSIACVMTTKEMMPSIPGNLGMAVVANPKLALYEIHNQLASKSGFYDGEFDNEVDKSAIVDPTASIADKCVRIGDGCRIGANVTILANSILESHVTIGPGTVIGCDPGLSVRKGGESIRIRSAGGVLIHRDVEIHSLCSISRSVFGGFTEIGESTKLDNLVNVGLNSRIGRRCYLVACAATGNNTSIGDDVWIGPNAVISDDVTVGNGAFITMGSVVVEDVAPGRKVTGNFAIDHQKFIEFIRKIR